ncbi:MAG: hypothetical protein QM307_04595 [Bacillota bacterium]|nr:hypothetical protein [Bacillota bacterium]
MYRISRDSRSSSCFLSGVGITEAAAVFPVAVTIADELLSTVLTGQGIKGLLVHLILVAVPVGHAALIVAVLFLFSALALRNGLATVMAQNQSRLRRMAL